MRLLIILGCLLAATAAEATERIAVLELSGESVEPAARALLTDRVREGVLAATRGRDYAVMTRENMASMARDMGLDLGCAEAAAECEVDLARNIGADFVVSGSVSDFAGSLAVAMKLHETHGGTLLASKSAMAKDAPELFETLVKVASQLTIDGLGAGAATSTEGRTEGELKRADLGGVERVVVAFESTPSGAVVLVDGEILCQSTPCSREVLEGQHRVEMRLEDHAPFEEVQELGRESRVLASLKDRRATLEIVSDSGTGTVQLDGRTVTAPGAYKVTAGAHEVRVEDRCLVPTVEHVTLTEGELRKVMLSFRPQLAGLDMSARGSNGNAVVADVVVDGHILGQTPWRAEVPLCSEKIQLVGTRGLLWERELRLVAGEVSALVATLSVAADPGSGAAVGGSGAWLARIFDADAWVTALKSRADRKLSPMKQKLAAGQSEFETSEAYQARKTHEANFLGFLAPANRSAAYAQMTPELAKLRADGLDVPGEELSLDLGRYDAEKQVYPVEVLWRPPHAAGPAKAAFWVFAAPELARRIAAAVAGKNLRIQMQIRPRWRGGQLVELLASRLVVVLPDGTLAGGQPVRDASNEVVKLKMDDEGLKGAWSCVSHDCFFALDNRRFEAWDWQHGRPSEVRANGLYATGHLSTVANDSLLFGATPKALWGSWRTRESRPQELKTRGIKLLSATAGLTGEAPVKGTADIYELSLSQWAFDGKTGGIYWVEGDKLVREGEVPGLEAVSTPDVRGRVALADREARLFLFDPKDGSVTPLGQTGLGTISLGFGLSEDGNALLMADDEDVVILDLATGEAVRNKHPKHASKIVISPDGSMYAVGGPGIVSVVDARTLKQLERHDVPSEEDKNRAVRTIAWLSGGTKILAGAYGESFGQFGPGINQAWIVPIHSSGRAMSGWQRWDRKAWPSPPGIQWPGPDEGSE